MALAPPPPRGGGGGGGLQAWADPECGEERFKNAKDCAGRVVVIRRGACDFLKKARNAMAAHAQGVIFVNNTDDQFEPQCRAEDAAKIRIPCGCLAAWLPGCLADPSRP